MPHISNSYVVGNFSTTPLTVYNKDGSLFGTLSSPGVSAQDTYLVKYNQSGMIQWIARTIGVSGTNVALNVAVDTNENVYVCGYFQSSTIQFLNGNGTSSGISLTNTSLVNIFIVKYNKNGNVIWATKLSGLTTATSEQNISIDSLNNIYILTTYSGTTLTIFNSDGSTFGTTLPLVGMLDCGIIKFNDNGFAQWCTQITGTFIERGYSIRSDPINNIYVGFTFGSINTTIYNSDGTVYGTVSPSGMSNDYCIAKYSSTGFVQWITLGIGPNPKSIRDFGFDALNNVYTVSQYITGNLTLKNSDGSTFGTLVNSGAGDICIAKYNSSGFIQWAAKIGGTSNELSTEINVTKDGNVYLIGNFGNFGTPADIYNSDGTINATVTPSGSYSRLLISKYNSNGFNQWNVITSGGGFCSGTGIAVDNNEEITGVGLFSDTTMTVLNSDGTTFGTLFRSLNLTGQAFFTIRYNKDGFVQWASKGVSDTDTTSNDVEIYNFLFSPCPPRPPFKTIAFRSVQPNMTKKQLYAKASRGIVCR